MDYKNEIADFLEEGIWKTQKWMRHQNLKCKIVFVWLFCLTVAVLYLAI